MIGLEAEYGYLGSKGSDLDPNRTMSGGYENSNHRTKIGGSYGYGLIGGRLGYAYERSLFYIKSGAVFTTTKTGYNLSENVNNQIYNSSSKTNSVGYGIGGGIEQTLPPEWFESAKHISIKAEYLYLGIERTQTSSGILSSPANTYTTTDHIRGMHTAKIGINYQFEGF